MPCAAMWADGLVFGGLRQVKIFNNTRTCYTVYDRSVIIKKAGGFMAVCSLCGGPLDPEGGAVLFTDTRGLPFEVCGKCEERFAVLRASGSQPEALEAEIAAICEAKSRETMAGRKRGAAARLGRALRRALLFALGVLMLAALLFLVYMLT